MSSPHYPSGSVVVTLEDDGVGALGLPGPEHLGLAGMRIRVLAKGGYLAVHTTPGDGTTVVLTLPTSGT